MDRKSFDRNNKITLFPQASLNEWGPYMIMSSSHGPRGLLQAVQRQRTAKVHQPPSHTAQCLASSSEGKRLHVNRRGWAGVRGGGVSSPEASMTHRRLLNWAWGCPEPPFFGDTEATPFPRAMELEPGVPTSRSLFDEMPHSRPTARLPRDGHPVPSGAVLPPQRLRVGGNPPCSPATLVTHHLFPPPLRGSLGAE